MNIVQTIPSQTKLDRLRDILGADCIALLNKGEMFYGHFIIAMSKTIDHRLKARAAVQVGDFALLRVGLAYFDDPLASRVAVIRHELLHIIFKHMLRARRYTDRQRMNIAADCAVNCLMDDFPSWGVFPKDFKLPDGMTFEWYYEHLPTPLFPQQGQSGPSGQSKGNAKGQPGQGSGKGKDKSKGQGNQPEPEPGQEEDSNPLLLPNGKMLVDLHDWNDPDNKDTPEVLIEMTIDMMIKSAQNRSQGNMPANIIDMVRYRQRSEIPWQLILRRAMSSTHSDIDWTMKRESKRYGSRPGVKHDEKGIGVIAVDSSGSISDAELSAFMSECAIAHASGLADIYVLVCDAALNQVIYPFRKIDKVIGRGGTDFTPVFKWSEDLTKHPPLDFLIYLTDGMGTYPNHPPRCSMLWVCTHDGHIDVDWGEKLKLPQDFEVDK